MSGRNLVLAIVGVVALILLAGVLYERIVPGLSSARTEPSSAETAIATWLLHQSVPEAAKQRTNPLGTDPADIAAGRDLFREKCEACHAYDGSGKTQIGGGEYPRPPALRTAVASISDGEIFYHIRNGIRNTGMPAWDMPDRQIWQLVAFIRSFAGRASLAPDATTAARHPAVTAHYVGSAACKNCHEDIYARWSKSRMANVVRDPREHPDAIIPDFSKPDPLVNFSEDDIAFVYGSRWKQRYFTKIGDDYFPEPAQWDVTHKMWRRYFVPKRPTGGRRFIRRTISSGRPVLYATAATRSTTTSRPRRSPNGMSAAKSAMGRAARMWRGQSATPSSIPPASTTSMPAIPASNVIPRAGRSTNPIEGKYYDWPVGFHVGLNLADYWKLEEHKLGETTFTHFADGTAHKNRMQGNDFVTSLMYARGVTCFSCHDPHGTENPGMVREPGNGLCLGCHGPNAQNGPHAATIEQHTHHAAGSAGNECIACHMPKIAETIGDVKVRSHTFHFVWPAETEVAQISPMPVTCATPTRRRLGQRPR